LRESRSPDGWAFRPAHDSVDVLPISFKPTGTPAITDVQAASWVRVGMAAEPENNRTNPQPVWDGEKWVIYYDPRNPPPARSYLSTSGAATSSYGPGSATAEESPPSSIEQNSYPATRLITDTLVRGAINGVVAMLVLGLILVWHHDPRSLRALWLGASAFFALGLTAGLLLRYQLSARSRALGRVGILPEAIRIETMRETIRRNVLKPWWELPALVLFSLVLGTLAPAMAIGVTLGGVLVGVPLLLIWEHRHEQRIYHFYGVPREERRPPYFLLGPRTSAPTAPA
jgi:hypothetical protein